MSVVDILCTDEKHPVMPHLRAFARGLCGRPDMADDLVQETRRIVEAFKNGPHIFNLGHGITPDADPENVHRMIEAVRAG